MEIFFFNFSLKPLFFPRTREISLPPSISRKMKEGGRRRRRRKENEKRGGRAGGRSKFLSSPPPLSLLLDFLSVRLAGPISPWHKSHFPSPPPLYPPSAPSRNQQHSKALSAPALPLPQKDTPLARGAGAWEEKGLGLKILTPLPALPPFGPMSSSPPQQYIPSRPSSSLLAMHAHVLE